MRSVLGLVALLVLLTGCGSSSDEMTAGPSATGSSSASASTGESTSPPTSTTVEVAEVTKVLRRQVGNRTGIYGTIKCGKDQTWPAPSEQQCLLTGEEVQARIDVTVAEDGSITWKML